MNTQVIHKILIALCSAQLLFWTLAPASTHIAPPLDLVEMLVWGQENIATTYKHPNLPGLLANLVYRISGNQYWPAYTLSQICIIASFICVYLLGSKLLGPARALAGTLMLTGIFYYSWPTPEFNHNVLQMPLWAGVCLSLWCATRRNRTVWWIVLGTLAGFSIWAKYSSVILLTIGLGWALYDPRARRCFASVGPWIAMAVFAGTAAPQVIFLIEAPLSPLDYALGRAAPERADNWIKFFLAQIADHAIFFVMAAASGLFGIVATHRSADEAEARRFLICMGLGPVLLTTAASAVAGFGLRDMWGMPMFNLSGLLLLALLPGRFNNGVLHRLAIMSACLLAIVPAVYAGSVIFRASTSEKPSRVVWPQQQIAKTLVDGYFQETGRLPDVVAGPIWEAGLIVLNTPGNPQVLIDGDRDKAPWVSEDKIAHQGALAVWRPNKAPQALLTRIGTLPVRQNDFSWSVNRRPIRLNWAVIPPKGR